jgi:hypothetical protein
MQITGFSLSERGGDNPISKLERASFNMPNTPVLQHSNTPLAINANFEEQQPEYVKPTYFN